MEGLNSNKILINDETLAEILSKSYNSALSKDEQLKRIIELLTEKLNNDAENSIALAPLLREFMELSIKNDDQLVKVASVLQRTLNRTSIKSLSQPTNNIVALFGEEDKKKILDKIGNNSNV